MMWRLTTSAVTVLVTILVSLVTALPAEVEPRAACSTYKQIYTGTKTVNGHGSETVTIGQLGSLGVGRVYLPGPGLVNAGTAATACKAACSLGINGKNCLSTVVYHKCLSTQGSNPDPFILCGSGGKDTSTGGFWYCDFYTEKLTASDFSTSGTSQGGNIKSSTGFVQNC
ncbi:hypothetical protein P389DRAFT_173607 [Cystobasidium minutum MCA 4210]|uniref:uncharacterized protein n=1 Tax=Cystobasidium minutum MCA 4210 TaxID=1397322 RepID=UPI0034CD3DCC|eukprot:jgi/Rhomi1/173607/fgenesh1_kg.6_\